jgi:NADH-quinone oxidoreductase subunit L
MAGPTPVSALIHAAMVTAGIFMITRLNYLFDLADVSKYYCHYWAVTSLVAATIALVQTDIKKVLAYSTVSQLGLMFLAWDLAHTKSPFFMYYTFFKASCS